LPVGVVRSQSLGYCLHQRQLVQQARQILQRGFEREAPALHLVRDLDQSDAIVACKRVQNAE